MNSFPQTTTYYQEFETSYLTFPAVIAQELENDDFYNLIMDGRYDDELYGGYYKAKLAYLWKEEFKGTYDMYKQRLYGLISVKQARQTKNKSQIVMELCEIKCSRMTKETECELDEADGQDTKLARLYVKFWKRQERAFRFWLLGDKEKVMKLKLKLNDLLVEIWEMLTDMSENNEEFSYQPPKGEGVKTLNGGAFEDIMGVLKGVGDQLDMMIRDLPFV